jgi:hypothetical protein
MEAVRGDLSAEVGIYCSGLLRFFFPVVSGMAYGDLDNKGHHLIVRVAEFGATIVKVDADRKHRQAQTTKLLATLKQIGEGEGPQREDPRITARRALCEAAGIPFVEPAPPTPSPTAPDQTGAPA